jgi:hypothetical protein
VEELEEIHEWVMGCSRIVVGIVTARLFPPSAKLMGRRGREVFVNCQLGEQEIKAVGLL